MTVSASGVDANASSVAAPEFNQKLTISKTHQQLVEREYKSSDHLWERCSRRLPESARVNIYIPPDLGERLVQARAKGIDINVSNVCQEVLRELLDRLDKWRARGSAVLGAFVVEDLAQGVFDLDQVRLIRHHLINVLIRHRVFVEERFGLVVVPRTIAHLFTK